MPKLPEWFLPVVLTFAVIACVSWGSYDFWLGLKAVGKVLGEPYAFSSFR